MNNLYVHCNDTKVKLIMFGFKRKPKSPSILNKVVYQVVGDEIISQYEKLETYNYTTDDLVEAHELFEKCKDVGYGNITMYKIPKKHKWKYATDQNIIRVWSIHSEKNLTKIVIDLSEI